MGLGPGDGLGDGDGVGVGVGLADGLEGFAALGDDGLADSLSRLQPTTSARTAAAAEARKLTFDTAPVAAKSGPELTRKLPTPVSVAYRLGLQQENGAYFFGAQGRFFLACIPWNTSIGIRCVSKTRLMISFSTGS